MKNTNDKIIERSDVVPIVSRSAYSGGNRSYVPRVRVYSAENSVNLFENECEGLLWTLLWTIVQHCLEHTLVHS